MVNYLIPEAVDEKGKIYTPEELDLIKRANPGDKLFQKLHCKYCDVRLEFRRKTKVRKAYLSTWPKLKHTGNCPLKDVLNQSGRNSSSGGMVELSSEDKRNKRDYLFQVLHSKMPHVVKIPTRPVRQSGGNTGGPVIGTGTGTVNPGDGGNFNRNSRSPRINHMGASELDKSLVRKTVLFYGELIRVNINDKGNAAYLVIKHGKGTLTVYTSPSYFQNNNSLVERFRALQKKINGLTEKPETYIFASVQYANGSTKLEAVIYSENDIGFPKQTLPEYLGPVLQ